MGSVYQRNVNYATVDPKRATPYARRVYKWIWDFRAANGWLPTLREIGDQAMDVSSTHAVSEMLGRLERYGFIKMPVSKSAKGGALSRAFTLCLDPETLEPVGDKPTARVPLAVRPGFSAIAADPMSHVREMRFDLLARGLGGGVLSGRLHNGQRFEYAGVVTSEALQIAAEMLRGDHRNAAFERARENAVKEGRVLNPERATS